LTFLNRTIRDLQRREWRKSLRENKETRLLMEKMPRENNTIWQIFKIRTKPRIPARQQPDPGQTNEMKPFNKGLEGSTVLRI
jgi:hypothetical protein